MITANGYSKDPSIMPEGIMLTLSVAFFEDRKTGIPDFIKKFWKFRPGTLKKQNPFNTLMQHILGKGFVNAILWKY